MVFRLTGLLFLAGVALAGCVADKAAPDKGVVDESLPPGTPIGGPGAGKADGAERVVATDVQSPHPYVNNMYETYRVDLNALPHCAYRARLHFAALRTEAGYDYLHLESSYDGRFQSFDGNHDGVWSEWTYLVDEDKAIDVVLETDYSITRHGFEIDAVEFEGAPICPAVVWPPCPAGQIDINPPPGVCECYQAPTCVPVAEVEIFHAVGGGFTGEILGKRSLGIDAYATRAVPGQPEQRTELGTIGGEALWGYVRDLVAAGVLHLPDVSQPASWSEMFVVKAGAAEVSFVVQQGELPSKVAAFADRFEALFTCGTADDPLTCGDDRTCQDGACVEDAGCFCTQQYDPVCGENDHTFGNACMAGCAGVPVRHDGECGITGDLCGGFGGALCLDGYKCRYDQSTWSAPYPDAAGACVAETYCDAPADCQGLPHIAVPGTWACEQSSCAWQQGSAWQQGGGWHCETAHPYGNNESVWKQLYLPSGATSMRLITAGVFELEQGYDKLEIWTWKNGAWHRVRTFTGTVGPSAADEFPGRYHYLHFVSDYSVTKEGFNLIAEYTLE
jgi:hypothetical protein